MVWLAQFAGFSANIAACLPFFIIIFAPSWLFIVIVDDITNDMAAFNNVVETRNNHSKILKRFGSIVQNHSDAKQ